MWQGDKYYYTAGMLRRIASSYDKIYDGISGIIGDDITDEFSIAEYKADFDMALNAIGKGRWTSNIDEVEFNDYKGFGKLQLVVIADIYNIPDNELEARGFYNISQMKGTAYHLMADRLNGVPHHGTRTQFKPSPSAVVV